jgi:hypothetical protein
MRFIHTSILAVTIVMLIPAMGKSQGQTETSRSVAGGGISVPGWTGKIDANEERAGQKLNNAKLAQEGSALHAVTGQKNRGSLWAER